MNKRQKIIRLIKEGRLTRQEIAKKTKAAPAYVSQIRASLEKVKAPVESTEQAPTVENGVGLLFAVLNAENTSDRQKVKALRAVFTSSKGASA